MSFITSYVCTDRAGGIGIDDQMAWSVPAEMSNFLENVKDSLIVVSSYTYKGLPEKFIENHKFIIVSRDPESYVDEIYKGHVVCVINDMSHLNILRNQYDDIAICGGSTIYDLSKDIVDRMVISRLYEEEYDCTHFFPTYDTDEWSAVKTTNHMCERSKIKFSTTTYERIMD